MSFFLKMEIYIPKDIVNYALLYIFGFKNGTSISFLANLRLDRRKTGLQYIWMTQSIKEEVKDNLYIHRACNQGCVWHQPPPSPPSPPSAFLCSHSFSFT